MIQAVRTELSGPVAATPIQRPGNSGRAFTSEFGIATHLGLEVVTDPIAPPVPERIPARPRNLPDSAGARAESSHSVDAAVQEKLDPPGTSASSGWLFPPLYSQLQADGQPDMNSAHCVADTWYANDYYADPKNFDPVAEQAKFTSMSDDEIMADYMTSESAFLATQFDASGKATGWPLGGNTDPATGRPFNAVQA
ncbi:MAG: hypothetical protein U0Q18_21995 [Bryobacteraceae bacterium]